MRGWLALVAVSLGLGSATAVADTARPVTVYLERHGTVVGKGVTIPPYGGGERAWSQIVSCVAHHFAPFEVDVTDLKPRGQHIRAVVGGWASQLGLSDATTNGVGPYNGGVIRDATVYVFSKVGTGERDVSNLCAVTAHEVAHAMGLDHSEQCGDIMSYHLDRCGTRRFLDVDAPCGESGARMCGNGSESQNSYRRLGALVGFRRAPEEPEPEPAPEPASEAIDEEPYERETHDEADAPSDDEDEDEDDDEAAPHCGGRHERRVIYRYRVYRVR